MSFFQSVKAKNHLLWLDNIFPWNSDLRKHFPVPILADIVQKPQISSSNFAIFMFWRALTPLNNLYPCKKAYFPKLIYIESWKKLVWAKFFDTSFLILDLKDTYPPFRVGFSDTVLWAYLTISGLSCTSETESGPLPFIWTHPDPSGP